MTALTIITPVGPGHEALFDASCAPSVEQAKAFDMGPFDSVTHLMMDDTKGEHGRSARRNTAIRQAQEAGSDWIFFLDADDILTPNAFQAFGRVVAQEPDLDVVWGLICTLDEGGEPTLREEQRESLNSREDFLSCPPYGAVQIGGFMRTDCVARYGFDEAMDTGEDYKLYCQLWKDCRCAKRPEIFFVNVRGQHSTGPRSATGLDWNNETNRQWAEQLKEVQIWATVPDEGAGQGPARMRVANPNDLIQMTHLRGQFFEADSLEKLKKLIRNPKPRIVEVGANIGNHVVWYARHLDAERIYPVEPNPEALTLLEQNIDANNIRPRIDTRGMGYGAGKNTGTFRTQTDNADNLGATRLVEDAEGGIETRTLDQLMGEDPVDFIKIDAEGMELDVLEGASALIARDKPVIWVEVLRENMLGFAQKWCRSAGYRIVDSTPYVHTIDYFAVPKE
ncbi:methyltransferase, FkbM family [Pseudooceanicola nitratireducens]|uniref:Methyltransferase, FkbM family n=2 Tax=Paracoccaceae TaxID=31989 RepID=A0A1I1PX02_9RHOB|nr:FkbM family methyltransferase [Pseudooceanicola nitratireducens]SEJ70948.1 methyltransferase, FkbM family [Pseudooceanicola nitratireducens]SFD14359.1 methyltransferase, FkbM family [Pseudooceanicola nitratireducens]